MLKNTIIYGILLFCCVELFGQDTQSRFTDLEKALLYPEQVVELSLKREKLKEWPSELGQFPNLKVLDLSNNKIESLPQDLSAFKNLEVLDLTGNKLDSLHNSIGALCNLTRLLIGNNEIYHVTERIGDLKMLSYLELWSNNIYYLPVGISELELLEEIDLRGIQMNEEHQDAIKALFGPSVNVKMSISCNCD